MLLTKPVRSSNCRHDMAVPWDEICQKMFSITLGQEHASNAERLFPERACFYPNLRTCVECGCGAYRGSAEFDVMETLLPTQVLPTTTMPVAPAAATPPPRNLMVLDLLPCGPLHLNKVLIGFHNKQLYLRRCFERICLSE